MVSMSRRWIVFVVGFVYASTTRALISSSTTTTTTTVEQQKQQQQQQEQHHHLHHHQQQQRNLQQSLSVSIVDATANFIKSSESAYDHEISLTDTISFHWNDPTIGTTGSFEGRLIHTADSISQAPSWLGIGIYKDNHNYTVLPITNFMIGSDAIIGIVTDDTISDIPMANVQKYHLGSRDVSAIKPIDINPTSSTLRMANILQHDSDDGTVTTDLTFTKLMNEPNPIEVKLRHDGVNVFLWAIGAPTAASGGGDGGDGSSSPSLSQHVEKGVFYLDFLTVQTMVEQGTTSTTTDTTDGGSGSDTTSSTSSSSGGTGVSSSTATNISPVVNGQCGSSVLPGGAHVALTPLITFHWLLHSAAEDDNDAMQKIEFALEYSGRQAWLGLGTSSNGYMIGSTAVIGIPGTDELARQPMQYTLTDQDIAGIHNDDETNGGAGLLMDASITSTPGTTTTTDDDPSLFTTVLKYTKHINDPNDAVPIVISSSTLNTFIYAAGSSRELNYHEHRGAFRMDVTKNCAGASAEIMFDDTDGRIWEHYGTFAAHGFFATLAFGLCSPFAVTVAWFRTLVPASWIYIHVFANSLSAVLTFLAFVVAVIGVAMQRGAGHFTLTHHWVGLLLTLVVLVQVINGFLRPPVERKDARSSSMPSSSPTHGMMMHSGSDNNLLFGLIAIPRTPRERWFFFHRCCGLTALAMGIYQVQSGLALYAKVFQTTSMVKFYFVYVGLFFLSLGLLKIWVTIEEDKARQGVAQAVSTTEPSPGDHHEDHGVGGGGEIVLGGFT